MTELARPAATDRQRRIDSAFTRHSLGDMNSPQLTGAPVRRIWAPRSALRHLRVTDDHSSAGFTAETTPVTTGLKLSSLLDYQIFQRARQEEGSIVFAGRLSGELAETATVEARLVVEGSTNAWRNVTTVVRGQRGDVNLRSSHPW